MDVLEQSFYDNMFSFVLDKCLEVEFLSGRIGACLTLQKMPGQVSKFQILILHPYQQCMKIPIAIYSCQHLIWSNFLITYRKASKSVLIT